MNKPRQRNTLPMKPVESDRLPPQNVEAEEGVLGAVIFDNAAMHEVATLLRPADFFRDAHQVIYGVLLDAYNAGKPLDLIGLKDELICREEFIAAGADETLMRITGSVVHSANATFHATIVKEKSMSRQMIDAGLELVRDCYSNSLKVEDMLATASESLFSISRQGMGAKPLSISQAIDLKIAEIDEDIANPGQRLTTGFTDLDEILGGFSKGHLIVVAGRTSMGKTVLTMNWAEWMSIERKVPGIFVTLEMFCSELAGRIICSQARVDNRRFRDGRLMREESERFIKFQDRERVKPSPLRLVKPIVGGYAEVANIIRMGRFRDKIEYAIVDYLNLIGSPDGMKATTNRQETVFEITRRLKLLAGELGIRIILVCQLNREVEKRQNREPVLSDLRESGTIEENADAVVLVWRPEYYDPEDSPGEARVIVAKSRNGRTGKLKLRWIGNQTRFDNPLDSMAGPEMNDQPY